MQSIFKITIFLISPILYSGCAATKAQGSYPSYAYTVAKYSPTDLHEGIPLKNGESLGSPEECECPKVWYRERWVYYCEDQWIYWNHGYWYYYPHFSAYYGLGGPHIIVQPPRGPSRSISKQPHNSSSTHRQSRSISSKP